MFTLHTTDTSNMICVIVFQNYSCKTVTACTDISLAQLRRWRVDGCRKNQNEEGLVILEMLYYTS